MRRCCCAFLFSNAVVAHLSPCAVACSILSRATRHSLVLVDELGRGTAHQEGLTIAWAVCEQLLRRRAHVMFITHFHELCDVSLPLHVISAIAATDICWLLASSRRSLKHTQRVCATSICAPR